MVISVARMYYIFRRQTCTSALKYHVVYMCLFMHVCFGRSSKDLRDCSTFEFPLSKAPVTVRIHLSLAP